MSPYNAGVASASIPSIIEERLCGGGHYRVLVVAAVFEGRGRVERHRLVYTLLADLMPGTIHALALRALSPTEWSA